jgi:hypothetical protein
MFKKLYEEHYTNIELDSGTYITYTIDSDLLLNLNKKVYMELSMVFNDNFLFDDGFTLKFI